MLNTHHSKRHQNLVTIYDAQTGQYVTASSFLDQSGNLVAPPGYSFICATEACSQQNFPNPCQQTSIYDAKTGLYMDAEAIVDQQGHLVASPRRGILSSTNQRVQNYNASPRRVIPSPPFPRARNYGFESENLKQLCEKIHMRVYHLMKECQIQYMKDFKNNGTFVKVRVSANGKKQVKILPEAVRELLQCVRPVNFTLTYSFRKGNLNRKRGITLFFHTERPENFEKCMETMKDFGLKLCILN